MYRFAAPYAVGDTMKKLVMLGCLMAPVAHATLVTGPDRSYVILSNGSVGYTVSSLSGEGNVIVQKMPSGYILLESDKAPTMIYEDYTNPVVPVIPVEQGLDMEISE